MLFYEWPSLLVFGEIQRNQKEKPSGLAQWVFDAAAVFCGREKMQSCGEFGQDSVAGPAMLYIMLVQWHRIFPETWLWIPVVFPPWSLSGAPG